MIGFERACLPVADQLELAGAQAREALESAARRVGCLDSVDGAPPGKGLRAALVLLASRFFSGDERTAVRFAVAVELVHAASLIHDDVIDEAPIRRGAPTVMRRIGSANAVLLGDVIFTSVFEDLVRLGSPEVLSEVSRAAGEACAGEVLQNLRRGDFHVTRREYLTIADLKTASLFRCSGVLGALSGGAGRAAAGTAGRFGGWMGMSFQITDDLIDVAGKATLTGKEPGGDLAQGKATLPVILHLAAMPARKRRVAEKRLESGDEEYIADCLKAMSSKRSQERVRRVARDYRRRAERQLKRLGNARETRALAALCRFAADRTV